MRYILKGLPSAEFEAWLGLATEDWQPTFDQLQNPQKRILQQALIQEQGGRLLLLRPRDYRRQQPRRAFPAPGAIS
ncbi:hypothetical protein [Cupriavidus sp. IDO]|uniref:hypothetical protein n=1 Tax=Cupriavidus sp. IDO TaxID=1539142 RepID=UPI00068FBCDC|nr:hypothetical protein [Cupriavidus sp. IDO]KWR88168.1 hypothetical protein RM96_21175 [Cupriavidus sp. IDO]